MGFRLHCPSRLTGIAGRLTGWNDQNRRCASVMVKTLAAMVFVEDFGQGAPILTQRVSSAMSLAASFPSGGMRGGSTYSSTWISKLVSGLPGTIAGPVSPPLSRAAREVIASLPLVFLPP